MLVISRKIGESFYIGDNIEATVIDITGEKVVLGVNAPKEIPIERRSAPVDEEGKPVARSGINARGYGRQYRSKLAEK